MTGVLRFAFLLAQAVWLGGMTFFSFVIAPNLFRIVGPTQGGDVVGAVLPLYDGIGIAACAIGVGTGLVLRHRAVARRAWTGAIGALAAGLIVTAVAATVVHPHARDLRRAARALDASPATAAAFDRAHQSALVLNGAALLAGLVALGCTAGALRQ